MGIVTVAGPDKIAIGTFIDFLRYFTGARPVILHSLMSKESIEYLIDESIKEIEKIIFSYYAKRKINVDPLVCIPEKLLLISEAVVWFDLYSTDFKLLKDEAGFEGVFRNKWKENIERINKLMQRG